MAVVNDRVSRAPVQLGRGAGGAARKVKRPPNGKPRVILANVDTPSVLIDSRVGSRELIAMPPLNGCGELCTLSSADVAFTGQGPNESVISVGVEVKSVLDLIQSMNTGRLQATQIPTMLQEYDHTWLLIYREYTCGRNGELLILKGRDWEPYYLGRHPMMYGHLEGHLITLSMAGVRVKRVATKDEAAWWIGVLARWYAKPLHKHKSMRVFDRSREVSLQPNENPNDPKVKAVLIRARIAAALPGIGFERAMAVARHFNSVEEMVNAPTAEWERIPGVGKVVARVAREAIESVI
jgi:ERCC4-type nuclease